MCRPSQIEKLWYCIQRILFSLFINIYPSALSQTIETRNISEKNNLQGKSRFSMQSFALSDEQLIFMCKVQWEGKICFMLINVEQIKLTKFTSLNNKNPVMQRIIFCTLHSQSTKNRKLKSVALLQCSTEQYTRELFAHPRNHYFFHFPMITQSPYHMLRGLGAARTQPCSIIISQYFGMSYATTFMESPASNSIFAKYIQSKKITWFWLTKSSTVQV